MRIIAGQNKGFKLGAVPETGIRPTADRIREAVFSILGHKTRAASVLDLFAGTGAMGLEALSRGAQSAVFVDNNPQALSLIRNNIAKCRQETQARVISADAFCLTLDALAGAPAFNLAFVDPPYGENAIRQALSGLAGSGCLEKEALVVCEHGFTEKPNLKTEFFSLTDQRRYGKTLVSFFSHVV